MAKTIADLEREALENAEFEEDEEDAEENSAYYNDLINALELLKKTTTALRYVADPVMCKTLSKRERDSMLRMAEHIMEFVDETEDAILAEDE